MTKKQDNLDAFIDGFNEETTCDDCIHSQNSEERDGTVVCDCLESPFFEQRRSLADKPCECFVDVDEMPLKS